MNIPRKFSFVTMFIVALLLTVAIGSSSYGTGRAQAPDLFFSEYIEGSSNNKALEIYNGTGGAVDLTDYVVEQYSNGSTSTSVVLNPSGILADGDVYVIAHSSADPAILAEADLTTSAGLFNGDDALVLRNGADVVDAFGQIGVDPGSEWPGGGADDTLRRKVTVCEGDADASDPFDASEEWDAFPQNTFDGLGNHTADCDGDGNGGELSDVAISEVRIDQPSTDNDEYFELAGEPGASLDGLTYLVIGDGTGGSGVIENVTDLSGHAIGGSGFFVAAEETFTLGTSDLTTDLNFENSDNVTHLLVAGFSGSGGDDLDTNDDGVLDVTPWSELLDLIALVEEENPPSGTEFHYGPPSVGPDGSFVPGHAFNCGGVWLIGAFDPVGGDDTPGAANNCPGAEVRINEIRIDQPDADIDEYFELAGEPGASLDGLTYLVIGDGTGGSGVIENVTGLSGQTIGSSGFFVAAEDSFTLGTADLVTTLNFENSDNVTHLLVRDFNGSNGDDLDTNDDGVLDVMPWSDLVDLIALIEEENPPSGTEYHYGPPTVGPDGSFVPGHVYLCDDGWRIGEFNGGEDTPGAENNCDGGEGPVEAKIHEVQGSGASVAITDPVIVEAVVVADYQLDDQLRGFFIQEEDGDIDADANTSEGIFVFCGGCATDVSVGDVVSVTGQPVDFFGMSQIDVTVSFGEVNVESSDNNLPTPATIDLPATASTRAETTFENVEGMLVTFVDELVVSEYFELARYGQLVLTADARPRQFTDAFEPSVAGYAAFLDDLGSRRIILDDDNNIQNDAIEVGPDEPYYWPRPGLSITNFVRGGDSISGLTGVLHWSFAGQSGTDAWRVRPVEEAFTYDFTSKNERTTQPEDVGGSLKVASFNVLNYFLTIDTTSSNQVGDCGPSGTQDCRGADSEAEFKRQRAKILKALAAINADIFGLIEMENTTDVKPLQDIVDGLNAELGTASYAYIDTGTIGTDAIKVGIIYNQDTVTPIGAYEILDSSDDPRFDDELNRPMLAQTFMEDATGGVVTVAVNHLKSKGSPCDDVGDPDIGDGQANCNLTRTAAAEAMVDWLATDPTGSGDADFLIIGDLNSYRNEDPIDALEAGGYVDLLDTLIGPTAYTYVFDGQLGYLDHALANGNLFEQVAGVTAWNINADEIPVFDYNDEIRDSGESSFERESSALLIYEPNAYRSSDHDPVIVGLDLLHYDFDGFFPPVENAPVFNEVQAGSSVPIKFSLNGDMGLDILAPGTPSSHSVDCATGMADGGPVEGASSNSGLTYDPVADQYVFVWQTDGDWSGTCRQFTLNLKDGSQYILFFRFR